MADESNIEIIRRTLAKFDPETRHQVIETMKIIRAMPVSAAARILAKSWAPGHFRITNG